MKVFWVNPEKVSLIKQVALFSAAKFALRYFGLNDPSKRIQITFGDNDYMRELAGLDCGQIYGSQGELINDLGYSVDIRYRGLYDMVRTLFHEMTHVDQVHKKRLIMPYTSGEQYAMWKYILITSYKDTRDERHNYDEYVDYPWEIEAREHEVKIMKAWVKSWFGLRKYNDK